MSDNAGKKNAEHQAPTDIWEANDLLRYDESLSEAHPLYVPMAEARGAFKLDVLLKTLGIDPRTMTLIKPPGKSYTVFCGHRGCGKSTELNQLAARLDKRDLYFVVSTDALRELDINNMQYPDLLIAIAKTMVQKMDDEHVYVDQINLQNLLDWFKQRITQQTSLREFGLEVEAKVKTKAGLPYLLEVMSSLTSSFKQKTTYNEELRNVIKNTFSEFANSFNILLEATLKALRMQNPQRTLLFIVDGTDRMRGDDSKRFFYEDVHQLKQIASNFIFSCPIHLLHEDYRPSQTFDKHIILPMIKLREQDGTLNPKGYDAMREMVLKRADHSLFDKPETLDRAVTYSGGNPRELIRILQTCFTHSDSGQFDERSLDRAIQDLAVDFKRWLQPKDYKILYAVDHNLPVEDTARQDFLLYNLALLEYNGFWRASHPLIRTLGEYQAIASP